MKSIFTLIEVKPNIQSPVLVNTEEDDIVKTKSMKENNLHYKSLKEYIIADIEQKIKFTNTQVGEVIKRQEEVIDKIKEEQKSQSEEYIEITNKLKEQLSKMEDYMRKLKEMEEKKRYIEERINIKI